MANKVCECCGKPLTGYQKKFCSSSCAAKVNNVKRYIPRFCTGCGKELPKGNRSQEFCSKSCHQNYLYEQRVKQWLNGEITGNQKLSGHYSTIVRRYLINKYNNSCQLCGWNKINPSTGLVPLEIHHIDGDFTNNRPENVQLLCPNCHSLTDNYGSRNKNCTRERHVIVTN